MSASPPMTGFNRFRACLPIKAGAAVLLIALGDVLFYDHGVPGWTLALFGSCVLAAITLFHPLALKSRQSRIVLALLGGLLIAFIEQPGPLSFCLFAAGTGLLPLLHRRPGLDVATLFRNLPGLTGNVVNQPWHDVETLTKAAAKNRIRYRRTIVYIVPPLLLTALFLFCFSLANPVMARLFAWVDLRSLLSLLSPSRLVFWLVLFVAVWGVLRPGLILRKPRAVAPGTAALWLNRASILFSLGLFNLLFALQNGMDCFYLWRGGVLPDGLTPAAYARAGAYPLIVTILMAAWYVLVVFGERHKDLRSAGVKALICLWIAQNMILAVSAFYRNYNYVEAYSLTYMRLAAFIWMGLIMAGLVTILIRIVRDRSNDWLLTVNALILTGVLYVCCFVDLGGVIAGYNVRHAAEITGEGRPVDLGYLSRIGPSAYPPLLWLRDHAGESRQTAITLTLIHLEDKALARQSDWHRWTWRNQRLIASIRENITESSRVPYRSGE